MYMNTILDETFSRLDLTASQKLAVCVHILACFGAAIGHRPYVDHGQKTYGNLNIVAVGSGMWQGGIISVHAEPVRTGTARPLSTAYRNNQRRLYEATAAGN